MRPPVATWTADYAHNRRKSAHRCRCCNRILKDGERVIMTRVVRGGTLAIHEACGALQHVPDQPGSWADMMAFWGRDWQRALGFKIPEEAA